jgi:hypothetical protein
MRSTASPSAPQFAPRLSGRGGIESLVRAGTCPVVGSPCGCLRDTCSSLSFCCLTRSCIVYPRPAERSNASYLPNPPDRSIDPKARKSLGFDLGAARLIQPQSEGYMARAPSTVLCQWLEVPAQDWSCGPEVVDSSCAAGTDNRGGCQLGCPDALCFARRGGVWFCGRHP